MDLQSRIRPIRLLILDVDGVLTNGQLYCGPEGEGLKIFHFQDGLGISMAKQAGLRVAIITGRNTPMVACRALELGIEDLYQGSRDKIADYEQIRAKYHLEPGEIAYVGDDLIDLGVMQRVGLACAVANAVPDVLCRAHFVSRREGGHGAVREIIELILKTQGKWDAVVARFLQPAAEHTLSQ